MSRRSVDNPAVHGSFVMDKHEHKRKGRSHETVMLPQPAPPTGSAARAAQL